MPKLRSGVGIVRGSPVAKGKQVKVVLKEEVKVVEVRRNPVSGTLTASLGPIQNTSTRLDRAVGRVAARAVKDEVLQPGEPYEIKRIKGGK